MGDTKNSFDFNTNWYEVWMKQSKTFMDSADKNLKDMFASGAKPENNMNQINEWLESLKSQWQMGGASEQLSAYENYVKAMAKICNDANELMIKKWIKQNSENNAIKNGRDLYELWLNCCNEAYKNAMHSDAYPKAYGDFMNAAIHFWKATLSK